MANIEDNLHGGAFDAEELEKVGEVEEVMLEMSRTDSDEWSQKQVEQVLRCVADRFEGRDWTEALEGG